MSNAVANTVRRFGFVSMILLALIVVMAATQGRAETGPSDRDFASIVAVVDALVPCPVDGCLDCGVGCADGCCHAPAVGLLPGLTIAMTPILYQAQAGWVDVLGAPFGERSGLKRPPRT